MLISRFAATASLCLRVAGLGLCLDARGSGISLTMDACHAKFLGAARSEGDLVVCIREGSPRSTSGWRQLFCDPGTWQFWRDEAGDYVFVAPQGSPPRRQLAIDAGYCSGELVGEFDAGLGVREPVYPLQDMDNKLYANWLAETGDVIVHAAGIDDAGAGYCFVGPSGVGKSTLAACVSSQAPVTVLGEDTVIVRRMGGRFMLYGTPWHTDPARCAPGGVPLKGVFFLDRSLGHRTQPCGPLAGIERLMQDAFIPYYNPSGVERILDNLGHLAQEVPFFILGFQPQADTISLIREA